MLMRRRADLLADERGMTLVELLVATSAGIVVLFGVTLAVIVTQRETNRVASHVDANQRARLTMGKVIDQLHSACVAYNIAPVQENSSGTSITFLHQTGSAVSPTPVKSTIALSGTTLSQSDYPATGGSAPTWTFAVTPSSTVQLMTGVSAISGSVPIFRYFAFSGGGVSSTPPAMTSGVLGANAAKAVQVDVAFKASPMSTPIANDSGAATPIQDSALLRLTPASFETGAENLPCQ
jgi:Tfp pilus assembly protein PilW